MTENSTDYSCDLELIEERLKNIESLLFTLQSNAPYLELEPFEAGEEGLPIENTGLENFIDGLGLRYFRGRELTPYWSRTCGSIRNSAPPQSLWNNLGRTLKVLDRLRDEIGHPIRITSSYRDPDYNASSCVGGEPNSQHSAGKALDFVAAGGTPDQWGAKLKDKLLRFPESVALFFEVESVFTGVAILSTLTRGELMQIGLVDF
jgi:hypothetical protein